MEAMKTTILIFLIATAARSADTGVTYWNAGELKAYEKTLAPRVNQQKVATETLGKYGNSLAMIAHREGDGEAEVHRTVADYFVVQSGEAILVTGGEVSGGRTTQPNEIRGESIRDGDKRQLHPGDIVYIPAGVPHQLLIKPGRQFTYFIVKVER
jgi:mannose-6-phosphate isomerase-like protein (cupin superfamily)